MADPLNAAVSEGTSAEEAVEAIKARMDKPEPGKGEAIPNAREVALQAQRVGVGATAIPAEAREEEEPAAQDAPPAEIKAEPEAQPEATEEAEVEAKQAEVEAEPEAGESEGTAEELPSLADIADAYGLSPQEFAETFKVSRKVDGKVQEITLDEALRDHQRDSAYRERVQRLGEERQQLLEQAQARQSQIETSIGNLDVLVQAMSASLMDRPNPSAYTDDLGSFDHEGFRQAEDAFNYQQAMLNQALAERENAVQALQGQNAETFESWQKEQRQLLAGSDLDFTDDRREKTEASIREGLAEFSAEELDNLFGFRLGDHRMIGVARDAAKFRQLQKGKKRVVSEVKKKPVLKAQASVDEPGEAAKHDKILGRIRNAQNRTRGAMAEDAVSHIERLLG